MMGRTHALSGIAAWLGAAPLVTTVVPLTPKDILVGAIVTAGTAMLPDIDHPSSTIARTFGPVTQTLAHLVAALAGGHRKATHGALFVGLSAFGAYIAVTLGGPIGEGILIGLGIGLAVRALGIYKGNPFITLGGCSVASLILINVVNAAWLPWAYGVGVLAHILGDMCTEQGVPFMWPSAGRWRIATVNTNSVVERFIVVPMITVGIGLLAFWNLGITINL